MSKETYEGHERRRQAWHMDKKVPIALIASLFFQTVALIVWAVRLEGRVEKTELSSAEYHRRLYEIETRERDGNKLVERVVRVETMLENVQSTVNRIDNAVYNQPKIRSSPR